MSIFTRTGTIQDFLKERPVSSMLLIINTIFLIITLLTGGFNIINLYKLGAIFPQAVKDGQYYRIITASFLHGSMIHFISNMIIGVSFLGSALEKKIGPIKFIIIYLISVIGSGTLVVFFSDGITIGASGGIFGVLGSLLYISFFREDFITPSDKQSIWGLTGIQVLFTFIGNQVSIPGHLGGLLAGFLISFLLIGNKKDNVYDFTQGYYPNEEEKYH